MSRVRVIALSVASLVVLGLAILAWTRWPPLLRFRIDRNERHQDAIILTYMNGKQSLEAAAQALADLLRSDMELTVRLQNVNPPSTPAGGGSLTAVAAALPPGVNPSDPRLKALEERAMVIYLGPENWEHLKRLSRQQRDSS